MIVCPPIAIVYIDSYYIANMIHAIDIWRFILFILGVHTVHFGCFIKFMLLILGVFIKRGNRSDIEMSVSTLSYVQRCHS
jgi:hypothetical protein